MSTIKMSFKVNWDSRRQRPSRTSRQSTGFPQNELSSCKMCLEPTMRQVFLLEASFNQMSSPKPSSLQGCFLKRGSTNFIRLILVHLVVFTVELRVSTICRAARSGPYLGRQLDFLKNSFSGGSQGTMPSGVTHLQAFWLTGGIFIS